MKHKKITKIFNKKWLAPLIIGIILIGLTPPSLQYQYPCLADSSQSYFFHQCNSTIIINRLIIIDLIIITFIGIASFLRQNQHSILLTLITTAILSSSSVAIFYLYLPQIIKGVESAPIIVSHDSLIPVK